MQSHCNSQHSTMWKPQKDKTFRLKYTSQYGYNVDHFNFLNDYKEDWNDYVAYVNESLVEKYSSRSRKFDSIPLNKLNLDDTKYDSTDEDYVRENFKYTNPIALKSNSSTTKVDLVPETPVHLQEHTKRNAFAIAVGGQITCIQWLPQNGNSTSSYFAVSLVNSVNGIKANDPNFSIFNKSKTRDMKSAIQIWKYDFDKNELKLQNMLITSEFGACSNLKWAPIQSNGTILGVLTGLFTDGNVYLFKIEESLPPYSIITEPSLAYKLHEGSTKINITSFDFIGSEKLVVGSNDGSIAEFMLPFRYNGNDIDIPNFKMGICWSAILSLMCIQNPTGKYLCIAHTGAHRSITFVYDNPLQDMYPTTVKLNTQPSFNYPLQNFVITNQAEQSQIAFPRTSHCTFISLARSDAYYTICKVSEILGHPFLITGATNGDICIMNYFKKFLGINSSLSKVTPLRIWKVLAEPDEPITLLVDVQIQDQDAVVLPTSMKTELNITAAAWNENRVGSSTYAVGTALGILLLERLDPKYL